MSDFNKQNNHALKIYWYVWKIWIVHESVGSVQSINNQLKGKGKGIGFIL